MVAKAVGTTLGANVTVVPGRNAAGNLATVIGIGTVTATGTWLV